MERLTDEYGICGSCEGIAYCRSDCRNKQLYDRLAYYEDMEEQGRLVVLPCKVGDTVYSKDGKAAKIEDFHIDKRSVVAQVSFECDYDCKDCAFNSWHTEFCGENSCDGEYGLACVSEEDFGKTVFLTREDAERALKEGADHE